MSPTGTGRWLALLGVAFLFALALAKFAIQDATRVGYPVNDLTTPWISSIIFMHGKNPYNDTEEYAKIWNSSRVTTQGPLADYRPILLYYNRTYPPTTLMLIAPLGLFKWHSAIYVYLVVSMTLLTFMLVVMARNLPFSSRDPRSLCFIAFALAMAPLHSGIHTANLSTLAVACLCAGVGFMPTRPYLSGIATAIAVCLKPQLAIFFFAYPWLRKKWKTAIAALVASAVIAACSLIWLGIHHVEWFSAMQSEVAKCATPPGGCSLYPRGTERFQHLNLQTLAFELTSSQKWSNITSWALFAILVGISVYLIRRHVTDSNESAGIAIISVLTLLPFYQNTYSAQILLFVLYWAVENWPAKSAKAAVLCLLPLLVPPLWAFARVVGPFIRFIQDHNLSSNLIWNGFVMLNVIWIELVLLLLVFAHLYKASTNQSTAFDN